MSMRSRKDQVQAHAYVVSRLTAALVHGEPDAPESPLRRTGLGLLGGVMLAVLGVIGFLAWGAIKPASGSATSLSAGELVMVSGTGSRYIYDGSELRPVLNWASALLLTGGSASITAVSAAQVAGIPHGQPVGLVGAPDLLPAASAINKGSWLACATAGSVSLSIGVSWPTRPLPPGDAVVASADGTQYLLWRGQRLRLDSPSLLGALGLAGAPVIPVSPLWLDAVPAGPDLVALSVPGSGSVSPPLAGARTTVGEILLEHNVGSASQYFVVLAGGIAPVTETQAAVLLATGQSATRQSAADAAGSAPVDVSPAAIASARVVSSGLADGAGAPPAPPDGYAPGSGAVCASYGAAGGRPPRVVFATPPPGSPPLATPGVTASPADASQIDVGRGGGALVRPQTAPGVSASGYYLVTSVGVKFSVPAANVAALGYRTGSAAALPASLLALLPTGPALDLQPMRG